MSNTMKCKILLFAGCFLIIAGISTVRAAENIIGDWTFTMEMPADMGGMGGPGGGMSMTINSTFSKGTDGVITGTWVMNMQGMGGPGGPGAGGPGAGGPGMGGPGAGGPGMGGPGGPGMGGMQMPAFKIVDVKIDGQKLSFTRKAEGNTGDAGGMGGMMSADRQFTGTIKGDAIELKSTSDFGEMTYKGTRKAAGTNVVSAATGLEGAWEFVTTFGDMGMEIKANATFKKEADGKYTCKWEGLPMEGMGGAPGGDMGAMPQPAVTVSDIKLDGEKLTFVQKVDLTQMGMGEMTSNFSGTLKGDKIEGKLTSEMGDNPTIGTRKKAAAPTTPAAPTASTAPAAAGGDALTGNWELTMSMGDAGMGMPMEFNIKSAITKDAAGKYAMTWQQSMNAPAGGMGGPEGGMGGGMPQPSVTISDIKLDGEKLTFTQKVSFGDMGGMGGPGMGGPEAGGPGAGGPGGGGMEMTSKFTGTVKNNTMEGKMSMEDSGMGMGAMEFTVKGSKK
jgi:hypothetical protein